MKRHLGVAVCVVAVNMAFASPAHARITRIVITRVESPNFDGATFDGVGPYEKIVGRAFGEIDPADPRNQAIVDIAHAPRNARGNVEYATDLYVLAPVDRSRGNHRVFFEINNRGNNLSFGLTNDATTGGNDPTSAADAGNGFRMRQGYTIVLSGWDVSAPAGAGRFTITVPVARNRDGSSITGASVEELVIDNGATLAGPVSYPAATLDKQHATLTTRIHYQDVPTEIPSTGWEYVSDRTIRLLPAGAPFLNGHLYEFSYIAKDPLVAGLAFAALRDVAIFLRDAAADDSGTANPLAAMSSGSTPSASRSPISSFATSTVSASINESSTGGRVFDATSSRVSRPCARFSTGWLAISDP